MTHYIVIPRNDTECDVILVNTIKQIEAAEQALAEAGLSEADVWSGDPDGYDSVKTSLKIAISEKPGWFAIADDGNAEHYPNARIAKEAAEAYVDDCNYRGTESATWEVYVWRETERGAKFDEDEISISRP